MMEIIEVVYENGVLIFLKKFKFKEYLKVIIKIIDEEEFDKFLDLFIIEKVENIDYKRFKEVYYELF